MPQLISSYLKVINKCKKNNWEDFPPFQEDFNYDNLLKIINYSSNRIEVGKTHKPKTWDEYLNLLIKYNYFGTGVTLDKMIYVYGETKGTEKFNNYRKIQAYSNTYEYKKLKYGMSLDEYKQYNKSRAITLENLIKKHGEIEGKIKYDNYCQRQAFTNTIEYFGEERYKEVGRLKSHTLDVYTKKYGEKLGKEKLLEFYEKTVCKNSYSEISQELFRQVEEFLTEKEKLYTYYATKNKEYGFLNENTCFLYDFVCTDLKLCIEYHGDHYHGNPTIYEPDAYLKGRGCTKIKAKDKWKSDNVKTELLKKERDYDTIVVWDSEWRGDSQKVLVKIKKYILKCREENEKNEANRR